MKSRWRVREGYFSGRAGTYEICDPSGEKINVHVDDRGYFELDCAPFLAIGIFAKLATALENQHPINRDDVHVTA